MPERVDYSAMTHMLSAAIECIRREVEELSRLDAATGDGDHGAAMAKVADAIEKVIAGRTDQDLSSLLSDIGWAAMGTDSGSTGPLYGSLFVGMSEGADGANPLDAQALADMLRAGAENLQRSTKAKPGDKTMIDALAPAVEAMGMAADAGKPIIDVLAAGAEAAAKGAEATRAMQAAHGRARNIGERSVGHLDPGAVSMSLLFAGFRDGFTNA